MTMNPSAVVVCASFTALTDRKVHLQTFAQRWERRGEVQDDSSSSSNNSIITHGVAEVAIGASMRSTLDVSASSTRTISLSSDKNDRSDMTAPFGFPVDPDV